MDRPATELDIDEAFVVASLDPAVPRRAVSSLPTYEGTTVAIAISESA